MSTSSAPSLRLEPSPPPSAVAALVALTLLACCAVLLSGLSLWLKLALLPLAGLLLVRALRQVLAPWPLLEWDAAGHWWLHGAGDMQAVEFLGASALGPLLVLRMRVEGRRRALLLTPDRLAADDLRRLRVRLAVG